MDTEKQVGLIFAGTQGFLDGVELEKLKDLEEKLFDFVEASYSDILSNIRESGTLSDEDADKLKNALNDFVKGF